MDPAVQESATNLLLDLKNEVKELKCIEIEENCRLGLGNKLEILRRYRNSIFLLQCS